MNAVEQARLIEEARLAAARAYCPYSRFAVGAAALAGGTVYHGANVENASFGLTICAERAAIFAAVQAGWRTIDAIAVACLTPADGAPREALMPCGACRQVLAEFAGPQTPIFVDRVGAFRLEELLPIAFRLPPGA